MDFRLWEDDQAMLEMFRTFTKQVVEPWSSRVEKGEGTQQVISEMAKAGLVGMVGPEEYGGSGCTYLQLTLAMEEIGRSSAAIADHLNMSNCNFILPLMKIGTEEQKREWIPRIASGCFCCFCPYRAERRKRYYGDDLPGNRGWRQLHHKRSEVLYHRCSRGQCIYGVRSDQSAGSP